MRRCGRDRDPRGLVAGECPLHQDPWKLAHDHPRMRHSSGIPGVSGVRLAGSEVAVEGSQQGARELPTVASLAAKQKSSTVVAPPDAVLDDAIADECQPIQVSSRLAAPRAPVEERAAPVAWQWSEEKPDPTTRPLRRRHPHSGRVESHHPKAERGKDDL